MSDWSSGYVAELGYTFGYYHELSPLHARFALLMRGIAPASLQSACELGFGHGVSINCHAAASDTQWWGTDFNPGHALYAMQLERASQSGAVVSDDSFEEFSQRADLPSFDFIALHGIWSWISPQNRAVIVDFVRKKLKVGGVLYLSYNTLPGWSGFAPVRHLMTQHAQVLAAKGADVIGRVNGALAFTEKLLAAKPKFAAASGRSVTDSLAKLKTRSRNYLAHEFFNRDWHPMYFADVAQELESAKVEFACSAYLPDQIDAMNMTADQRAMLAEMKDEVFRQGVRDFVVNQQFRRDYWVRGARRLTASEQVEAIRRERLVLTTSRDAVPMKVNTAMGEAKMSEAVYGPILDAMADHKARAISDIERAVATKKVSFAQLREALMILVGSGHLAVAQDDAHVSNAQVKTQRLNRFICDRARFGDEASCLASPVTGGGVTVTRFQQLFLLAADSGLKKPEDWARFAWQHISLAGQKLVKDGKALESPQENLTEMTRQAKEFATKRLPVLRALGI